MPFYSPFCKKPKQLFFLVFGELFDDLVRAGRGKAGCGSDDDRHHHVRRGDDGRDEKEAYNSRDCPDSQRNQRDES